jgi:NAD(P)-dependent dehydrogenase (short-subunit alcohol dehydrogenase family)
MIAGDGGAMALIGIFRSEAPPFHAVRSRSIVAPNQKTRERAMGMLDGKVIILAGVGGIGDEVARRYVEEGARLVFGDIEGDHAVALGQEIDPKGERALGVHLDGADETSIAAMIQLAQTRFGRIDGFHCNFAHVPDGLSPLGLEIPLDMFDDMVRVNLRGYFLCSRLAVPAMIENGGGVMLYTSSAASIEGSAVRFTYAMCKAGINSLMRNVAFRYGAQGIRSNAIAPGLIVHHKFSGLPKPYLDQEIQRTLIKSHAGRPDDIASMGAFLLSDNARFITGQTISVDGGITMRL